MRVIPLLTIFASLAVAIKLDAPAANHTYKAGQWVDVIWSKVDADPPTLSLFLVNFINLYPPYYTPLVLNVPTDSLHHKVQFPCDLDLSPGYQINAINGTNTYDIYAQTGELSVTEPPEYGCTSSWPYGSCWSSFGSG
jgi:hypothetical protein